MGWINNLSFVAKCNNYSSQSECMHANLSFKITLQHQPGPMCQNIIFFKNMLYIFLNLARTNYRHIWLHLTQNKKKIKKFIIKRNMPEKNKVTFHIKDEKTKKNYSNKFYLLSNGPKKTKSLPTNCFLFNLIKRLPTINYIGNWFSLLFFFFFFFASFCKFLINSNYINWKIRQM